MKKKRVAYNIRVISGKSGWFWRMESAFNGKTICHSEIYSQKFSAMKTARGLCRDLKRSAVLVRAKDGVLRLDSVHEQWSQV